MDVDGVDRTLGVRAFDVAIDVRAVLGEIGTVRTAETRWFAALVGHVTMKATVPAVALVAAWAPVRARRSLLIAQGL